MAPQSVARGALRSGDRAAAGMLRTRVVLLGRRHPATGSHLPLEETAPPSAVAPFASSPFAHPIPQSHRRASGDLFNASLSSDEKILNRFRDFPCCKRSSCR